VKGWRPIVLLNTIRKLGDKVLAELMIKKKDLFHKRTFARRKGKGAIDSVMLMDEIRKEVGGDIYGRDIKSAFKSQDRDVIREVLRACEDLRNYVDYCLRPRTFEIRVDGRVIGKGTMVEGTPQGSLLSPTLFMSYLSAMVWEADRRRGY